MDIKTWFSENWKLLLKIFAGLAFTAILATGIAFGVIASQDRQDDPVSADLTIEILESGSDDNELASYNTKVFTNLNEDMSVEYEINAMNNMDDELNPSLLNIDLNSDNDYGINELSYIDIDTEDEFTFDILDDVIWTTGEEETTLSSSDLVEELTIETGTENILSIWV